MGNHKPTWCPRGRSEEDCVGRRYDSWRQVAGYFDGDGAVYVSVKRFVLRVKLCFYDVWKPQLEGLKAFFASKGISTNRLASQERPLTTVWYLTLSDMSSMKMVIRKILPFTAKKRGDLLVALDYLEDRITANEAIRALNRFVTDKRRSGFIRKVSIPYTRVQGILEGRRFGATVGSTARLVKVPASLLKAIRTDRAKRGTSVRKLHLRYGYSERIIRRILRS
jgi:hypothetical protein